MTDIGPDNSWLRKVNIVDVATWLATHGRQRKNHPNRRLIVFEGPPDDNGTPIVVALPNGTEFRDTYLRLSEVINTLAVIYDQSPERIIAMTANSADWKSSLAAA